MRSSRVSLSLLLALTMLGGCRHDTNPLPSSTSKATIRRTSYGIPHIQADGYRGLGAGIGYAQAQDAVCILADQFVKVRGERASYFGHGDQEANVESDLVYRGLGLRTRAEATFASQSAEMQELAQGYAEGYNQYLTDTPADHRPAPCTGATWVKPITAYDLLAYHLDLSLFDTLDNILPYVANAQPPAVGATDKAPRSEAPTLATRHADLGSNGWAIGRERSTTGQGLLVANPHFPWEGSLRFHESHQTIPGKLDVYGVSLLGVPVINIGFNHDIAWTHTVAASSHMTLYRLQLVPQDPTAYVYDGQVRRMTSQEYSIDVLETDGTMKQIKRTFWRSHYGPMLKGPGADWSSQVAYTARDANEGNDVFAEHWLRLNAAHSIAEAAEVERVVRGAPWINTLMTSTDGTTRYVDASRVPALSDQTVAAYRDALQNTPDAPVFASLSLVLLDGSTSRDEWVDLQGEARGLVPVSRVPQLVRNDFVMNANDPATYTNPAAPLRDLPFLYEIESPAPAGLITPRTHMNLTLLTERGDSGASGGDGLFTREELEHAILSDRAWSAEQLLAPVVKRCQGAPPVLVDGASVDITAACRVLASWDGRLNLDSQGAVVWREFLNQFKRSDLVDKGALYTQPFDPLQPIVTPAGLVDAPASGTDPLQQKLGQAVALLGKANIGVDARLGDVQFARKGERHIPLHGGATFEGTTNVVGYAGYSVTLLPASKQKLPVISPGTGLTPEGYLVDYGTSFLMVLEFTPDGPRANGLLTYAESTDPASPHFADQSDMFSNKQLRPILFTEADIVADPSLTTTQLEIHAPATAGAAK